MTGAWHVRATLLPDGDTKADRWLVDGRLVDAPVDGAEELPGRWALPGLVDAHCHLSMARDEAGPRLASARETAQARERVARQGVGIVRDLGGDRDVMLAMRPEPGRPDVLAVGRHLAPKGYYFDTVLREPAEPEWLVEEALREVRDGARWVKLVADFPPGLEPPARPTYDVETVRETCAAVHDAGARVAAHITLAHASDLVEAGVDSVEHGSVMDEDTLRVMAARGAAWTPTLCASMQPPAPGTPPERARAIEARQAQVRTMLPLAVDMGVPVLTGSDVVGSVPEEIAWLVRSGVEPRAALAAATTVPRSFLGSDVAAMPESLVTYSADPRDDPEVLVSPAAVVVRGVRVV